MRRRLQRAYLFRESPIILMALALTFIGLTFFYDGINLLSALGPQPPWDTYYNAFYLAGGLVVLLGVLTMRVGLEVAGHMLLFPACAVYAVVSCSEIGLEHRSTVLGITFALITVIRPLGLLLGREGR